MADDAMRHIGLFQVGDLFLGQIHGQGADGIVQMRIFVAPMMGAVTGSFCNSQASAI